MKKTIIYSVVVLSLFLGCGEAETVLPPGNMNADAGQAGGVQWGGAGRVDAVSGDSLSVAPRQGEEPGSREQPRGPGSLLSDPGACVLGEPSEYPTCCEATPARCVPEESLAHVFTKMLAPCDGGFCVPEPIFELTGHYTPPPCASLGGKPGVCMSLCLPDVEPYAGILPQDVCPMGELCTPCVSPLDGLDTGACDTFECTLEAGDDPEPEPEPEPEPVYSCETPPTEPVVDMQSFAPCCDGAHCVPTDFVPEELVDDLNPCPGGKEVCVPDEFVAYAGYFTPPTCMSPGNVEGRCLSTCLPIVAESLDSLVQAECNDSARCVPCCDPITGENTGACDVACDTGPSAGMCEVAYNVCCSGEGRCIPNELIPPEDKDSLNDDGCGSGFLCVPDILREENPQIATCSGSILFQMPYSGVCLPKCLDIPLDDLIWSGSCNSDNDCVPCTDPLTGDSTGAPGCAN